MLLFSTVVYLNCDSVLCYNLTWINCINDRRFSSLQKYASIIYEKYENTRIYKNTSRWTS